MGKILAAIRASGYEPHPGIDDITCHEGGYIPFWAPEGGGPPQ